MSSFDVDSINLTPATAANSEVFPLEGTVPVVNCLLLGDASAEKTALVDAYLQQYFPEQHSLNCVFFEHTINISVKGVPIIFNGQECYDKLRQLAYKQIRFDVFLVCFSLVEPDSFENVRTLWVPELKWNCPNRPFFLVGTQSDLRTDKKTFEQLEKDGRLPVTRLMGQKMANQLGARKYLECSATRKQGLKELFDDAILIGFKKAKKGRFSHKKSEENCTIQ